MTDNRDKRQKLINLGAETLADALLETPDEPLRKQVMGAFYLMGDETPVKVQYPKKKAKTHKRVFEKSSVCFLK